jgi:hypothetical protein
MINCIDNKNNIVICFLRVVKLLSSKV